MPKTKDGLQLRKIGSHYMIVDTCTGNVNMSNVFSLNDTAAQLWTWIEEGGHTPDELADLMCQRYLTDKETALADIKRQLAEWEEFDLLA